MINLQLRGMAEGMLATDSVAFDAGPEATVADAVRHLSTLDERIARHALQDDGVTPRDYFSVLAGGQMTAMDRPLVDGETLTIAAVVPCDG